MIKVVLLTDLDNTIIYGKTKYRTGDICVEKDAGGKEITFMGREAFERFALVQDKYKNILEVIPVTSKRCVGRDWQSILLGTILRNTQAVCRQGKAC